MSKTADRTIERSRKLELEALKKIGFTEPKMVECGTDGDLVCFRPEGK